MNRTDCFMSLSSTLLQCNASQPMHYLDDSVICYEYMPVWVENTEHERQGLSERVLSTFEALQEVKPKLSEEQLSDAMLSERNGSDFVKACQQLMYLCQQGYWPSNRHIG
ncbi:hypothetical protein [Pseudoalteromonas sp. GB56]